MGMMREGWRPLTSLYVMTQIVTTVGYGDKTVTDDALKIFMTFYVMGCLVFLSYVINKYAERVLQKNDEIFRAEMARVEARLHSGGDSHRTWAVKAISARMNACINCLMASGGFLFFLIAGTCFYALFEGCTCSYGTSKVEGCIESPRELCYATGGHVKTWVDAYYMSVITLTTVGFGDIAPKSY